MAARAPQRRLPAWPGAAVVWLLCLCAWALPLWAQAPAALPPVPALDSPVRDDTGTLDPATRARLEARARELRARSGAQLQVLIVASAAPEDIATYAQRVFDAWALGRAGVDDGVLLVVARDDRRARIQVGYGLEGRIPDAAAQDVLSAYLLPHLARGEYGAGVDAASAALAALIEQEPLPAPAADAYAAAAPAWSPLARICALGGAFALALGWCAQRRGWPLAWAAPAALLPPAVAAWVWSGPAWLWLPLLCGAAAGALGLALPRWRWLRSVAGAAAVGLAVAALGAALVRRGVPAPGDIGLGAVAVLFATPLLVGLVAPPMIAWQERGRLGFALRVGALAAIAWLAWRLLLRTTDGDLSGLGAGGWLGVGLFGYFAWVLVFLLSGEIWSGRSRKRDGRAGRGRGGERERGERSGGAGPSRSESNRSEAGGSDAGDTGWSGGGGRSGGGGASGSW
ncbi:TPM domain-containing protein [Lysobacter enzymogenes]|uniref:TPM domain-containing protein n=1 Tax=Lysobacter enzymogenes TaxID=69 RepID=A0A3N2RIV2_LYSEN|nr:TPM domain-containing protein [Lysobacter enzymogenes]ROU07402.1 TPM domain-containing protein [Lysobacter enzymogenes]